MKNKYKIIIISIVFITVSIIFISIYSQEKFKTYNFIKAIYGINKISEENLTYVLEDNVILIYSKFKNEYSDYLTSIYESKGWNLNTNDAGLYIFCDKDKNCDCYKMYLNNLFTKSYALLVKEN